MMKVRLVLAIILSALSVLVYAQSSISDVLEAAKRLQQGGKLQASREMLEKHIRAEGSLSEPNDGTSKTAALYSMLGSVCEDQGYISLAAVAYRKGVTSSSKINDRTWGASSLNGLARMQTNYGSYDSVLLNLALSRELDSTRGNLIEADQAEGRYWQAQNQYDKALEALHRALDNASAIHDDNILAIILSSIGSVLFSHNPDMNVALDFYRRSNDLGDSLKPSPIYIRTTCRMANSYMVTGDLKLAEQNLRRARRWVESTEYLPLKAYVLSSWSILLAEHGDYKAAADFADEPIRINRQLDDKRQLQKDLLNVAELRMMIGQNEEARKLLGEGISIGHDLHDVVFLKYFYNMRARLDTATGDYRLAYSDMVKAVAYKDSTFSVDHLRAVNEIREKYEAEQKEKIIAEKELQIEEQKYQRAVMLGALVIAVLASAVVFIVLKSRSSSRLQNEKQLRLQAVVRTQEETQQRIARDLHDGLVQVLGAAQLSLESVSDTTDPLKLHQQIRTASGILDDAVMEARSISHQVLPYSILKGGLVEALEELMSRNFDEYEFQKPAGGLNLSESKSINVFRIVQELVNNVRKHAEASFVRLVIVSESGKLKLIFEDNGKGFDPQIPSQGVGLSNLKTRAEMMNGSITISSALPKGTRIELTLGI
ncbi:ATP-binding protein [Chryseolinea sp. T2]|uniref:ATP-binding protein n=1 Tax=Chryseolinea sp. T2 TaxID=3129255 RepID=UPI00307879BC